MEDLHQIEKRYKELHTEKLVQLAKEAHMLRPEVIPLLKTELIRRGEEKIAFELDSPTAAGINFENISLQEIQELVAQRLEMGESIESIRIDLSDNGINVVDLFNKEGKIREEAFEHIASSTGSGVDDSTLNKNLKEKFDLETDKVEELKAEMRSRANFYTILGSIITLISFMLLIVSIGGEGIRLRNVFIAFGIGIFLIIKGVRQNIN